MIGLVAVVTAQTMTAGLGATYLAGGVAMAAWLQHRGQPRGTVLGALVAWPLLLPLVDDTPPDPAPEARGPLRERIDRALAALASTLGDPAAGGVCWQADLEGLRGALYDADARLALVDRLLADDAHGAEAAAAQLRAARQDRAQAVEAVLAEVHGLRMQVGMAALAGDDDALAARLRELSARAATLAEVGAG